MKFKYLIKIITVYFLLILSMISVAGCVSKEASIEEAKERAYNDIREELLDNGHPIGMFGVSWNMTQQEVKQLLGNCSQLNTNTIVQEMNFYGRPIKASFHFTENRLLLIVVSFADKFKSVDEYASAFYLVQEQLSLDYGKMPEPVMNDIIPPVNDQWTDQLLIGSSKQMGRTNLTHQITIKNNSMGEQILMYLGKLERT